MASEIKLPPLGENLTGGDVLDIRVPAGSVVHKGQALIEIEAEKSTVEVPAPEDGKVVRWLVEKGNRVEVGQTFCVLESVNGEPTDEPKAGAPREETAEKPKTARAGDRAPAQAEDQDTTEADEAEEPEEPKKAARLRDRTPPETKPAAAEQGNGAPRKEAPTDVATVVARSPDRGTSPQKIVPAGPATRRLARELGVELTRVTGSGPNGRVTPDDVKAFVKQLAASPARGIVTPPLPDFGRWGPVERRALDGVRRKTAEQMALAWSQIPHVTQHDQADITDLDAFRKQQDGRGPKLTVTAFALKACAIALKQDPQFNASLDLAGNQLIVKQYVHVGVAVDTERGLLVPVIRDVDQKSVSELAKELTEIAERAREKKLGVEEMRGGTFTITNLGGIGGTAFTPIVNYPEVAILGLSRARLQPAVHNGQVTPRLLLPLSLSYDHRVIDGADAARFTRRVAAMLENPLVMLLDA